MPLRLLAMNQNASDLAQFEAAPAPSPSLSDDSLPFAPLVLGVGRI